ncbi:transcriptional regulator [Cohnella xylanilytica]|uniref:helix-turn-helix domain-containing protein n=1 Tax=Cohnella xylanilytica TaxID=557555 RepID=UPI001B1AE953|nr:helix-turn-helix transcriptional regulator [Cohnella xylanilytica]GIO13576.1 transcriptional regulator [Cohnella xylanilytica]
MAVKLDWLVEIRGELTQEEAAEKCGISRSTYANYESGNRVPPVDSAMKIAQGLEFEKHGLDWTVFFDQKRFETKRLKEVI